MRVLILDAIPQGDGRPAVGHEVETIALAAGASVKRVALVELVLAPCQGELDCWLKTPGLCRTHDAMKSITQDLHDADLAVFVCDVTFGGFSASLKRAVDRLICLIEPFFQKRSDGLTHHAHRYGALPSLLTVGWEADSTPETADTFRALTAAKAIDLGAPSFRSVVLSATDSGWRVPLARAVREALANAPSEVPPLERFAEVLTEACSPSAPSLPAPVRSTTLLVGSARPKGESTSESLGRGLLAALERGGGLTRVVHAVSFTKPGRAEDEAVEAMLGCDLLVVSTPLYVDSLPALPTRALEVMAHRLRQEPRPRGPLAMAGIVNCGFPEAVHTRLAMRILRTFATRQQIAWAGGLAMGGGEALHGTPLPEAGGLVRHQARALEAAGAALAQGQSIPEEAITGMQAPLMPPLLYRWMGTVGWVLKARNHGVHVAELHARPLASVDEPPP